MDNITNIEDKNTMNDLLYTLGDLRWISPHIYDEIVDNEFDYFLAIGTYDEYENMSDTDLIDKFRGVLEDNGKYYDMFGNEYNSTNDEFMLTQIKRG